MNIPLKTHGGKHYLARQIIALLPSHTHYVEPYLGGGAVFFAKPFEGISEVVNDLNGDLMTFWHVLQEKKAFADFKRRIEAVPFSETEWQDAQKHLADTDNSSSRADRVERAVRFFILCRQSMAGRCQDFAPLTRTRTRRGMNEQVSAWLKAIDGLHAVHARLQRVVILNRPAVEVIRSQDGPETLFYLDPPYLPATRSAGDVFGELDMTEAQHEELLDVIKSLQGKVMLSGYGNSLYDTRLAKWHRHEFDLPNNAAGGVIKRRMVETIWCNFRSRSTGQKEVA
jgi:DNA adenine methylase